jgi:hypothetical protein
LIHSLATREVIVSKRRQKKKLYIEMATNNDVATEENPSNDSMPITRTAPQPLLRIMSDPGTPSRRTAPQPVQDLGRTLSASSGMTDKLIEIKKDFLEDNPMVKEEDYNCLINRLSYENPIYTQGQMDRRIERVCKDEGSSSALVEDLQQQITALKADAQKHKMKYKIMKRDFQHYIKNVQGLKLPLEVDNYSSEDMES